MMINNFCDTTQILAKEITRGGRGRNKENLGIRIGMGNNGAFTFLYFKELEDASLETTLSGLWEENTFVYFAAIAMTNQFPPNNHLWK